MFIFLDAAREKNLRDGLICLGMLSSSHYAAVTSSRNPPASKAMLVGCCNMHVAPALTRLRQRPLPLSSVHCGAPPSKRAQAYATSILDTPEAKRRCCCRCTEQRQTREAGKIRCLLCLCAVCMPLAITRYIQIYFVQLTSQSCTGISVPGHQVAAEGDMVSVQYKCMNSKGEVGSSFNLPYCHLEARSSVHA